MTPAVLTYSNPLSNRKMWWSATRPALDLPRYMQDPLKSHDTSIPRPRLVVRGPKTTRNGRASYIQRRITKLELLVQGVQRRRSEQGVLRHQETMTSHGQGPPPKRQAQHFHLPNNYHVPTAIKPNNTTIVMCHAGRNSLPKLGTTSFWFYIMRPSRNRVHARFQDE